MLMANPKGMAVKTKILPSNNASCFILENLVCFFLGSAPNGERYPQVGGAWTWLEASINPKWRKQLVNRAESHLSGARCVGRSLEVLSF